MVSVGGGWTEGLEEMLLGVEGREGIRGEPELDVQGIRGDE